MPCESRVVVVTGSSTGIGLHICLALAKRNYKVIATLRTPSRAPASLRESSCSIHELDVTSATSASALASYVRQEYGGCDVLINNAGWGAPGTLETVSVEHAKEVFEVNVWGAMRMVQEIVPLMRERGGGLVVTVSSTSGWRGIPCSDIYTGSKQAIEGMMDSFRYAVQKDNIKVCMVNPGPTDTPFTERFRSELKNSVRADGKAPESQEKLTWAYIEAMGERNSGGQKAEDCARAIADVVDRELPKRIDDGSERARFWNPTSEFGQGMLEMARVCHDGSSGPMYDPLFEQSLRQLNEQTKAVNE